MRKEIGTWKPVALDASLLEGDFEGLVAIEECSDYDLQNLTSTKAKPAKKKKKGASSNPPASKKIKLDGIQPSKSGSSEDSGFSEEKCEDRTVDDEEALESVTAWSSYGLSRSLLLGLSRAGFKEPTEIQALSLPAAIHGENYQKSKHSYLRMYV